MKRFALLSLFALLIAFCASAQDSALQNRLNFKLGHSSSPEFFGYLNEYRPKNFRLEANYALNRFLDAGVYLGLNNYNSYVYESTGSAESNVNLSRARLNALFVGVNSNIHILPLFIKNRDLRLDLYVTPKLGLLKIIDPYSTMDYTKNYLDYSFSAGASYYLTKRWGVYAEYGLTRSYHYNNLERALWYGVTFKF